MKEGMLLIEEMILPVKDEGNQRALETLFFPILSYFYFNKLPNLVQFQNNINL